MDWSAVRLFALGIGGAFILGSAIATAYYVGGAEPLFLEENMGAPQPEDDVAPLTDDGDGDPLPDAAAPTGGKGPPPGPLDPNPLLRRTTGPTVPLPGGGGGGGGGGGSDDEDDEDEDDDDNDGSDDEDDGTDDDDDGDDGLPPPPDDIIDDILDDPFDDDDDDLPLPDDELPVDDDDLIDDLDDEIPDEDLDDQLPDEQIDEQAPDEEIVGALPLDEADDQLPDEEVDGALPDEEPTEALDELVDEPSLPPAPLHEEDVTDPAADVTANAPAPSTLMPGLTIPTSAQSGDDDLLGGL